ncbi:hypothetical protein SBA4_570003 [Candidatus Sulfopaludibacter sp. SbA4]|nr:hypothetical protein SBA4_570003 [Candidatus Sulfopaludibacter sp. SbA4]
MPYPLISVATPNATECGRASRWAPDPVKMPATCQVDRPEASLQRTRFPGIDSTVARAAAAGVYRRLVDVQSYWRDAFAWSRNAICADVLPSDSGRIVGHSERARRNGYLCSRNRLLAGVKQ